MFRRDRSFRARIRRLWVERKANYRERDLREDHFGFLEGDNSKLLDLL